MDIRVYVWGLAIKRSDMPKIHYSPYVGNPNKGFSFLETLFRIEGQMARVWDLGSGFRFAASGFFWVQI